MYLVVEKMAQQVCLLCKYENWVEYWTPKLNPNMIISAYNSSTGEWGKSDPESLLAIQKVILLSLSKA